MKTKIKFVLQAKPENTPGWPHINFNYRQAADQMLSVMQARMPEACFDTLITSDAVSYTHLDVYKRQS